MTSTQWMRQDLRRAMEREHERRYSTGVPGPAACQSCGWTSYRTEGAVVRCCGCGSVLGTMRGTANK